jgi:hypothetical protein
MALAVAQRPHQFRDVLARARIERGKRAASASGESHRASPRVRVFGFPNQVTVRLEALEDAAEIPGIEVQFAG